MLCSPAHLANFRCLSHTWPSGHVRSAVRIVAQWTWHPHPSASAMTGHVLKESSNKQSGSLGHLALLGGALIDSYRERVAMMPALTKKDLNNAAVTVPSKQWARRPLRFDRRDPRWGRDTGPPGVANASSGGTRAPHGLPSQGTARTASRGHIVLGSTSATTQPNP